MTMMQSPIGSMVAFYWTPTHEWLVGEVVDHLPFAGKIRHGVRVDTPTKIDPTGCPGGRVYDVWPDMSLAPAALNGKP